MTSTIQTILPYDLANTLTRLANILKKLLDDNMILSLSSTSDEQKRTHNESDLTIQQNSQNVLLDILVFGEDSWFH